MTKDTEVDMKDVELNDVDPEKQPMTSGDPGNGDAVSPVTEKNGSVTVKIADEKESKFTGLSKEELLKVAGTPGWVRARWALLILFWLGWIGMLAGAVLIIVQAPRCKTLPEMNWWDYGSLYQVGDVDAYADSGLAGLQKKIDYVGKLKVKGLVIGPIHASTPDKLEDLNLEEISSGIGKLEELKQVIEAAHKKSISVVLDLTPNYKANDPWFSGNSLVQVANKVKSATEYWLKNGVDGILLHGVESIADQESFWSSLRDTVNNHTQDEQKRVLIGVTTATSVDEVSRQLNMTGVDLLMSEVLNLTSGIETAEVVERLYSSYNTKLAWNLGDRVRGHLATLMNSVSVKLTQLMLLTLPGTPVFNYGDEIGLEDENGHYPEMLWLENMNETKKEEKEQLSSLKSFFKSVSDYRVKERSLQHGDYLLLHNSTTAMAYMRKWDQSERFIIALNWHSKNSVTLQLTHNELPGTATVVVSTDAKQLLPDSSVNLAELTIGPQEAVMLKFPYTQ